MAVQVVVFVKESELLDRCWDLYIRYPYNVPIWEWSCCLFTTASMNSSLLVRTCFACL